MEITVKMVANAMTKMGVRKARKKIKLEWPNTPDVMLEGLIRFRGVRTLLPVKAANVLDNSDYTDDQIIRKLLV